MLEYNYLEDQSLEDLNILGGYGWEINSILESTSPNSFNVFISKGFQDKVLIENIETGTRFWINEVVDYGDVFIIFILFIFITAILCKSIYKFFYQQL